MISLLQSLCCLIVYALASNVAAWVDETCQHGPWPGRLRGLDKTQIPITNENRSETTIPAEFTNVSHPYQLKAS
jgi:hypothetical protein